MSTTETKTNLIGLRILVNFRVEDGKTVKAKPAVQRITDVYMDADLKVKTHTGDVFNAVRKAGHINGANNRKIHYDAVAIA